MSAKHVNAKKPVLKLRLGPRSSEPQDPDPAPVSAPKPPPAMNPKRAAHIAELEEVVKAARAAKAAEIAKTVEARKPGKAELKRRATALLGVLCDRYPKAFDIEHPRPLKVGIDRDIAVEMDDTSLAFETDLRNAVRLYTSRPAYLTAMMTEEARRIDLAGNTVEAVKQPHAGFAKFRLKRMGANG
jgi:ProP effector